MAERPWPPEDPYLHEHEESISLSERLKTSSPWTYGNDQFNPELIPSNRASRLKQRGGGSQVPPYHPSYRHTEEEQEEFENASNSGSDGEPTRGPRVRRGSEGFEVQAMDREEILQRYIATRGEEATRFRDR